jgi:hypothetical protein
MLGLICIGISGFAAYRLHQTALFVPAIINAVACLWSMGVMSNFKDDPTWPHNNWDRFVGGVSMLTSLGGIGLLIASFIIK